MKSGAMDEQLVKEFAEHKRAFVVGHAGCGKTQLIAKAVTSDEEGRHLVLTHTHAGVRALRKRLKDIGAPSKCYRVNTLAGFALRYASSFPRLSCCTITEPTEREEYNAVYEASVRTFQKRHIRDILARSYTGMYVDEYQDCTQRQHELVLMLADVLPCRIVGDPLQGIFDFDRSNPMVDWDKQVGQFFQHLFDLEIPYRWLNNNRGLGQWVTQLRVSLLSGRPFDLRPYWKSLGGSRSRYQSQIRTCMDYLRKRKNESVAVIQKWPNQAHDMAKKLKGLYQSMEEVECKELINYAVRLETTRKGERAACLVEFVTKCVTVVPKMLSEIRKCFSDSKEPPKKYADSHPELIRAMIQIVESDDVCLLEPALNALLETVKESPGTAIYREELLREMQKTLRNYNPVNGDALRSTAWKVRDQARQFGRRLHGRLVSRTLLVKGLEFDHAVILNADYFDDAKNLYVALTRGSKSLIVLSERPQIQRPAPFSK